MTGTLRKTALIVALLSTLAAGTARAESSLKKEFKPFLTRGESTWALSAGVRRNDMDWNIATDPTGTTTPNILSELTWSDVTLLEIKGEVRHDEPLDIGAITGDLHLEAQATGGLTVAGDNQDSDYLGDNRTGEFSRSSNSGSEGSAFGGKLAVGYRIALTGDPARKARAIAKSRMPRTERERALRMQAYRKALKNAGPSVSLTPLLGYGWDQQTYRMTDGNQTVETVGVTLPLGPFSGLDSEYTTEWYGPFIGAEAEIAGKKNRLRLRGEYHDLTYHGEGIWNLRTTFLQDPSFTHDADGTGLLLNAQYAYALSERNALTLDGMYQKREATDGTDTLYLNTGAGTSTTRLNEVNDSSYALRVGLRRDW